jgi:hypothetical protein
MTVTWRSKRDERCGWYNGYDGDLSSRDDPPGVVKETRHKHASSEFMRQISDGCFEEVEYSLLVYVYILNLVPHATFYGPAA